MGWKGSRGGLAESHPLICSVISERNLSAAEATSVVNLSAKTSTNGGGYSVGRIERIGLVEAKYGVAQFVYS
jgi:hypothetical protein